MYLPVSIQRKGTIENLSIVLKKDNQTTINILKTCNFFARCFSSLLHWYGYHGDETKCYTFTDILGLHGL